MEDLTMSLDYEKIILGCVVSMCLFFCVIYAVSKLSETDAERCYKQRTREIQERIPVDRLIQCECESLGG